MARWRGLGLVVLAAGVFVILSGSAGAVESARVPAKWDFVGIGARGRSLELVYTIGGCLGPAIHASVSEDATSVTISLEEDAQAPGAGVACPDFIGSARTTVRLSSPLAGRAILGRPTPGFPPGLIGVGSLGGVRVPRLGGFDPADARHVLGLYALHERVAHTRRPGLARVVAQTPAAGTTVDLSATVRVVISGP